MSGPSPADTVPAVDATPDDPDLALALRMADAADAVTLPRFRARDLRVETKPDRTPVTDADHAAEAAVLALVAAEHPGDAILAEESGAAAGDTGREWIVDPIDGTRQFLRGVPTWASLVALRERGATTTAVVSAPALGRRWWAVRGAGAFMIERAEGSGPAEARRLHVSAVDTVEDAFLAHAEPAAWHAYGGEGALARFVALALRCWQARGYGDFWAHMLVAEGAADVAVEVGPTLWDLAAPALIVAEAGGRFTSLEGDADPGRGSGVSTNGRLHDAVLAALAPAPGPDPA